MFFASLVGEPLLLRFDEIAKLTDRQLIDIYRHPRDKDGRLIQVDDDGDEIPEELTPEQARKMAIEMMKAFGITPPKEGETGTFSTPAPPTVERVKEE